MSLSCDDVVGAPPCCNGCHGDAELGFEPLRGATYDGKLYSVCCAVGAYLDKEEEQRLRLKADEAKTGPQA